MNAIDAQLRDLTKLGADPMAFDGVDKTPSRKAVDRRGVRG